MGVTYIKYKIAECDICGKTEQFDSGELPDGWNGIRDRIGLIDYGCICNECSDQIREYIESLRPVDDDNG